ncbi:MAG: MBL fold metallo-hydrolase [Bacteroidia bacterium]
MLLRRLVNNKFNSNTYLLTSDSASRKVCLIDCSYEKICNIIDIAKFDVSVFITHFHYDHIIALNYLFDNNKSCKVYASKDTFDGLFNSKVNLSYYRGLNFEFKYPKSTFIEVKEGDDLIILNGESLRVLDTSGHCTGCRSYVTKKFLFTGDSLIPFRKVVTKLPGGDKINATKSVKRILTQLKDNHLVCAGHGPIISERECSNFKGYF